MQHRGVGTVARTTASLSSSLPASESKRLVLTGLAPGVIYEWQVRTVCPSGVPSSYTLSATRFQVPIRNVFVGVGAGQSISTGVGNVGIGTNASFSMTTASRNVALGDSAGTANLSSGNVFVGSEADVMRPNLTNATAIGLRVKVAGSNAIVLGDTIARTNVGIGVTAPQFPLDVRGIINLRDRGTLKFSYRSWMRSDDDGTILLSGGRAGESGLRFEHLTANTPATRQTDQFLTVNERGEVVPGRYRVRISTASDWADRVFAPTYALRPLSEIESYVKTHLHLPGIPSAETVVRDGIDGATLQTKLLEKVEELTLYMIQQQQRIEQLEKRK